MSFAFLSRAKPQNCDALQIFLRNARVFLGYPLARQGKQYDPEALCTWMVNPATSPEPEWRAAYEAYEYKNQMHATTRNLIRDVEAARMTGGALVVIPRQRDGCVYVGKISQQFEIVCAPPWRADYLDLRDNKGLDTNDVVNQHTADVAQGWRVTNGRGQEGFLRVDFSSLPGWLQSNLLGRQGIQRIYGHPLDKTVTAYSVFLQRLNAQPVLPATWTLDVSEIKKRLVEYLNPSSLEHLVVSLLQLENRNEIWRQVGGAGDGGVDGIGSNEAGETVGLLQVKFRSDDPIAEFGDQAGEDGIRRYVAILLPEDAPPLGNDANILLDLDWMASALQRHWRDLPLALSMRVGETP